MALRDWLQLAMTAGIGPILTQRLIVAAGSAAEACIASPTLIAGIEGIGQVKATKVHASLRQAATLVDEELDRAASMGVTIICRDDERYPVLLRSIPDPPVVLYIRGTLEDRDLNAVAIVGSRKCSYYGREQADRFAALLAGSGFTVISGGARGVDSAAHRGALSHPAGRTIAVLGCGVDVVYPPESTSLFDQIAQRGALVSEYPLGTSPLAENFPRRNRIVSGMSRGVLVVEADVKSGALITARQAADDHNRPVFAIPGRIDNPLSAGPHLLIRDGAVLVEKLEDLIEGLEPLPAEAYEATLFDTTASADAEPTAAATAPPTPPRQESVPSLTERQQLLLEHLSKDPANVDQIIERTALPAHQVLQELTLLSLKGIIRRVDGQTYARCSRVR